MEMRDMSLADFAGALGSKAAVPGGGGASALVGALGAALGAMVGELTVGKPKYAAVEEQMRDLTDRAKDLSAALLALVDEDAEAFKPLSRAYGIPKDDPGRADELERCLRVAAEPPLKMVRLCCQAIGLMEGFAAMGSVLAVSDAATGAALCRGAMYGAAVNVKVNTNAMADRAYAGAIDSEVDRLLDEYHVRADRVYEDVYGRYC